MEDLPSITNQMNDVICKEVVITNLSVRGGGETHDPCRRVLQVWEKNGELIAEYDPMKPGLSAKQVLAFLKDLYQSGTTYERVTESMVNDYIAKANGF